MLQPRRLDQRLLGGEALGERTWRGRQADRSLAGRPQRRQRRPVTARRATTSLRAGRWPASIERGDRPTSPAAGRCGWRSERPFHQIAGAVDLSVDVTDRVDEGPPQRMLHRQDRFERPVEVVGDVRDLFHQLLGRVRHDPPGASPLMSTANPCAHVGHVTSTRVPPSWLIRRYRSCRNARSEANRFSMTRLSTSGSDPSCRHRAGQQQHRQVRRVLANPRIGLRPDLVAGRGQAHHSIAMQLAAAVDVAARQRERELGAERRPRRCSDAGAAADRSSIGVLMRPLVAGDHTRS